MTRRLKIACAVYVAALVMAIIVSIPRLTKPNPAMTIEDYPAAIRPLLRVMGSNAARRLDIDSTNITWKIDPELVPYYAVLFDDEASLSQRREAALAIGRIMAARDTNKP